MPDGNFDGKNLSATLPTHCGVYRMLDGEGTVLYVGKARNLRKDSVPIAAVGPT